MRVLGQTVEFGRGAKTEKTSAYSIGQHVAVSGLRLPDQTIVASLVEIVEPGAAQLVGVVTRSSDRRLAIGAQPLSGVAEAMLGQRIMVRGAATAGALDVTTTSADAWLPRGPDHFLVETYLERRGATVKTASGLELGGGRDLAFQGVVRAVVGIDATSAGAWSIRSLQASETLGNRGAAKEQREARSCPSPEAALPDRRPPPGSASTFRPASAFPTDHAATGLPLSRAARSAPADRAAVRRRRAEPRRRRPTGAIERSTDRPARSTPPRSTAIRQRKCHLEFRAAAARLRYGDDAAVKTDELPVRSPSRDPCPA